MNRRTILKTPAIALAAPLEPSPKGMLLVLSESEPLPYSYATLQLMMDQSPLLKAIVTDRVNHIQMMYGGLFANRGYLIAEEVPISVKRELTAEEKVRKDLDKDYPG